MEGVVTFIEAPSHFPVSSVGSHPHLSKSHHQPFASRTTTTITPTMSTRKRKPIVTYQSPDSGVLDMALLIRNTALEFEAAAAMAAASRSNNTSRVPGSSASSASSSASSSSSSSSSSTALSPRNHFTDTQLFASNSTPDSMHSKHVGASGSNSNSSIYTHRRIIIPPPSFRPITIIPRAPHPLYHPLSQQTPSKHGSKNNEGRHAESGGRSPETGRRSSSRTRRPVPKMRETESGPENLKDNNITEGVDNKSGSPAKRRRGGVGNGKRRRAAEADGDSAYPAVKRSRKQPQRERERDKNEMDGDGGDNNNNNNNGASNNMPPPTNSNDASPPSGYSTRARRPRTAAPQVIKDDSGSDGTGSVARTTPVNGAVEEFWVPTKVS